VQLSAKSYEQLEPKKERQPLGMTGLVARREGWIEQGCASESGSYLR